MLHYIPQHVSSSTLLIIRRNNFITTASGIVTLENSERSYINKMRSVVGSRNPGRAVGRMSGMFSGGRIERSYVEIYGLLLNVRLALDQTRDAN
jgi:hypothetical protein